MTLFSRAERVGGQIQKILSEILLKDVQDPRLEMTIITAVKMSKDLKIARIYFTVTGGKSNTDEALKGFKSAAGFLKADDFPIGLSCPFHNPVIFFFRTRAQ